MAEQTDSAFLKFRSGLSLQPGQMAAIEMLLQSLLESVPAKMIIVVETSGQLVSAVGDIRDIDTTGLGSLIAGDLAASQEIARLTGEFQEFQMVLREGHRSHIILSEAGPELTFLVQFSKDVPLGWARKMIQKAAGMLQDLANLPDEAPAETLHENLGEGLPDLFNDALDDMWKG